MDIWTKLNDEIPDYFGNIVKEFQLKVVKINDVETALVGNFYAIIISIDRFYADVDYVIRNEDKKLEKYRCSSFFAKKYDAKDRENLLEETGSREIIINNLKVINRGLLSKWRIVLEGDTNWLEDYIKSEWKMLSNLRDYELKKLQSYI